MDRSLHVTSAPPTLNGPGVVDKAKPHPSLHDIKIYEDLMYKSKPLLSPMTLVGEDNNHLDDTNDAICRICYSETGSFINPCDCHGTMGTLHRDCLLEWVQKCGSVHCEMCGHQYASKVCTFKPFLKWSAPNLSRITIIRMLTLLSLFYITFYSLSIMKERKWVERTVKARSVPRPHDLFVLILIATNLFLASNLLNKIKKCVEKYMKRQYQYTFSNLVPTGGSESGV